MQFFFEQTNKIEVEHRTREKTLKYYTGLTKTKTKTRVNKTLQGVLTNTIYGLRLSFIYLGLY